MRRLIRESEWLRVYQTDVGQHYESRLLSAEVPHESVLNRWDAFGPEERWEIALALQLRGKLEEAMVPLVNFMLERGDIVVRSTLAPLLPLHPNKQAVVEFLLSQVRSETNHRANYFQALALIGDPAVVMPLMQIHEKMGRAADRAFEKLSTEQAGDFIACSEALWRLTGLEHFRSCVEKLRAHPDDTVRSMASVALRSMHSG